METAQTVSQVLKDQFVQASYLLNFDMGISLCVSALSSQFGNTQYNHRPFFRCHARAQQEIHLDLLSSFHIEISAQENNGISRIFKLLSPPKP